MSQKAEAGVEITNADSQVFNCPFSTRYSVSSWANGASYIDYPIIAFETKNGGERMIEVFL